VVSREAWNLQPAGLRDSRRPSASIRPVRFWQEIRKSCPPVSAGFDKIRQLGSTVGSTARVDIRAREQAEKGPSAARPAPGEAIAPGEKGTLHGVAWVT
jgi:hypothetical protein